VIYRLGAQLVVLTHFGFVVFVVLGVLFVLRWRSLMWVHLPVALWGVLIEFGGWVCPLTPLENWFRHKAGRANYSGGFLDHYLFALLYPDGLTRTVQIALGVLVLAINLVGYWYVFSRRP